jgi:hypothetical protein
VDSFGHAIEFSFNKREGKYKTKIGGFLTIVLNCLILQQTYLRLNQMVFFKNDTIQSNETSTDLEALGEVSYHRMKNSTIPVYAF